MKYEVTRLSIITLVLSLSIGCAGNSSQGGQTVHVGAEIGPLEVRVNFDSQGKPSLALALSKRVRLGLGPVGITFGITEAFNTSHDKPYYLFIVWQDSSGTSYRDEYVIGRKFRVTFDRQEWVKEIAGQNDSIIVVVVRSITTPSPDGETPRPQADIPSVNANVTSLRFYESGYEAPPYPGRNYQTQFSSGKTRYIYWELNLSHPAPDRRLELIIEAVYYSSDGTLLTRQSRNAYVDAGWTTSWQSQGWGGSGIWRPGSYRLELVVEGKRIAGGAFSIYEETATQSGDEDQERIQQRRAAEQRRQQEIEENRTREGDRREREIEVQRRDDESRRQQAEARRREDEQRRKDERAKMIIRGVEDAINRIGRLKRN